jgi:hypothetical protein
MAVADTRTDALASAGPAVNTRLATCGHRACKAFTGASAALKSSPAGVAVVTRPRVPGPARSGRSWRPANGSRPRAGAGVAEAADVLASPAPACAAQAASCQAPSKAPIERPWAFLSWRATPPWGRGSPSSRFDLPGSKHPRRGTMFPDGSGVPLRFTKENCHVCKSSNESATARRRAARRVGTRFGADPAATAPGRPAASCRGVRVHSSASRLVTRPATRPTRPAVRVPPQSKPNRRQSSNQGSPPSPLGVPVRSPTKESTPC